MRKLKRKNQSISDEKQPIQEEKAPRKKRRVLRYKKQKCAFVSENGVPCNKYAVGKSTLCKKHGGNPVIKENLIPKKQEKDLIEINCKFNPEFHPITFIRLSRIGLSTAEIAVEFDVSIDAMKRWAEKYDSFNEAWECGKDYSEAWWIRKARENIDNRSINTPLFKFMMMNKFGYSDKVEQRSMNMNVHGVLMIPDKMSEAEWEEEVIDV